MISPSHRWAIKKLIKPIPREMTSQSQEPRRVSVSTKVLQLTTLPRMTSWNLTKLSMTSTATLMALR